MCYAQATCASFILTSTVISSQLFYHKLSMRKSTNKSVPQITADSEVIWLQCHMKNIFYSCDKDWNSSLVCPPEQRGTS